MFYNARYYDSSLGRFASADTIVPGGVQGLDRYAYVNNSPMNNIDPSGHVPCEGDNWDDGPQCEKKNPGIFSGCSINYGVFNGRYTCTADDINKATITDRQTWFNDMLNNAKSGLSEQFTNINGILNAFQDYDKGSPGTWVSWGDAGILTSIQNGLAKHLGKNYIQGYLAADNAWATYFASYFNDPTGNSTFQAWGAGEAAGTAYGMQLATEHGAYPDLGEQLFLMIGNNYRAGLLNRVDPLTITTSGPIPHMENGGNIGSELYGWVYNPSSTIPGFGVAPVEVVANTIFFVFR